MPRWIRTASLVLVIALSFSFFAPTRAVAAGDDYTNEIVSYGLLGAVVGILVYLGWKMDRDDEQEKADLIRQHALADAGQAGRLLLVAPAAREGEQITALGYGLTF